MLNTLASLVPVIAGLVIGHLLRRFGVTERRDGELLFKVVFYVCGPAIIFGALARIELTRELVILPLLSLGITSLGFLTSRLLAKRLHLTPAQVPLFVVACMIVNSGFALPFVQAVYGTEGVAALAAFDLMNTALTFTWMYAIAARGNPDHSGESAMLRKLYTSPVLYAIALGLLINLSGVAFPKALETTATVFGTPTGFLITLAIGTVFNPSVLHLHGSVAALSTRLLSSLAVGGCAVWALDLDGTTLGVVALLCVAPIGFNTVTFASLENLDVDFAASTLSLSLVVSTLLSTGVAVAMS